MKIVVSALAAAFITTVGASASAGVIYAGPSPEQPTDTSIGVTFNSATATTTGLSFTIDGYSSLDGQNFYEDDFGLSLNGSPLFAGTFNLGGGSSTTQAVVYLNPDGATLSNPTNNGIAISFAGGKEIVTFGDVLPLVSGINTLIFNYTSLPGPSHAGFQGIGDEGWGIENVTTSIPEPSTWIMMALGFAGLGYAAVRRSAKDKVAIAI
jgi:PEP-CTERM motif